VIFFQGTGYVLVVREVVISVDVCTSSLAMMPPMGGLLLMTHLESCVQ
jgi:hypothetical protein